MAGKSSDDENLGGTGLRPVESGVAPDSREPRVNFCESGLQIANVTPVPGKMPETTGLRPVPPGKILLTDGEESRAGVPPVQRGVRMGGVIKLVGDALDSVTFLVCGQRSCQRGAGGTPALL